MVARESRTTAKERVIALLDDLPDAALTEVVSFVEYQRYKLEHPDLVNASPKPVPVKLGGLLAGSNITPEDIANIRAEMWDGISDRIP